MPPKKDEYQTPKLQKRGSLVSALDKSGQVFKAFYIWSDIAPAVKENPDMMFAQCLVLPGSTDQVLKCRQMDPPDRTNQEFDVKQNNAFNFNSNLDPTTINDIGLIPHTNMPCVLDFLAHRFNKALIYSTADPLLVAINPFKDLGNVSDAVIMQYRDAPDVAKLSPHVFSIARVALENLHGVHKSQTIIVCGESGAGKTEATKQIMRYFAAAKGVASDFRIQKAVLAANPVLEAFGNAKTLRNDNSSRFGRFMQFQIAVGGGILFGSVRNFLLEKSRILFQENDERSYHVFYQLLKGASADLRTKLQLKKINEYNTINTHCLDVASINDVEDFELVDKSFDDMGMSKDEKHSIYSIISGILLIGNCTIKSVVKEGLQDAAEIDDKCMDDFKRACGLMFLNPEQVEESITVKFTTAGDQVVKGCWKQNEAVILIHSLSKAMYDKLFDWIIKRLNRNIEPESFQYFMGMLDIFGFEVFKNNSLEQLFINVTNEMLQKNFIDVVFERETKLYRQEGISAADLQWTTNKDVIEMLTKKKNSLMSTLEDLCLAPGGNDEKFVFALNQTLKDNEKLVKAKINSNINFIVVHTIGEIQYCATNFLTKNKDVLRSELVEIVKNTDNVVAKQLFEGVNVEKGKLAKGQLIGSQFLTSLEKLVELINSTEPHFIRCVKPNEQKKPGLFVNSKVLVQLHALSILEALQLRNLGYSYRRPFDEFIFQFKFIDLGISEHPSLDDKIKCTKLFQSAQVTEGWQIGKTMVFMKSETQKLLVVKQRQALSAWEPVVSLIECIYSRQRNWKGIRSIEANLIRFQAHCRKYLAIQREGAIAT